MTTEAISKQGIHYFACRKSSLQLEVLEIDTMNVNERKERYSNQIHADQLDYIRVGDYCFIVDEVGKFKRNLPIYAVEAIVNDEKEDFYIYGHFLIGRYTACSVAVEEIVAGFENYNDMNEFFQKHQVLISRIGSN